MIKYNSQPINTIDTEFGKIPVFGSLQDKLGKQVIKDFGDEWSKFSEFSEEEIESIGAEYFDLLSEFKIDLTGKLVLDAGCGSGRWSKALLKFNPKYIVAMDPSSAVFVAKKNLSEFDNCSVIKSDIAHVPLDNESVDFIMSIGVLHHIPDMKEALKMLTSKLKSDGILYGYMYYGFDNKGFVFKTLFRLSNFFRIIISNLPGFLKRVICELIAFFVYLPLSQISRLFKVNDRLFRNFPLSYYHNKSYMIMRNDALDRFGTRLEQRFTKNEIQRLLEEQSYKNIRFSKNAPYWHFVATKI